MNKQIKKVCNLCKILENPQYAFSPVVLKERIKGLRHTCQPPQQPVENKGWEEDIEKRFIKWAEERDDDWWENEQERISIWDFRIMFDFFKEEFSQQRTQERKRILDLMDGIVFDSNKKNSEQFKEFEKLMDSLKEEHE